MGHLVTAGLAGYGASLGVAWTAWFTLHRHIYSDPLFPDASRRRSWRHRTIRVFSAHTTVAWLSVAAYALWPQHQYAVEAVAAGTFGYLTLTVPLRVFPRGDS